MTSVVRLIGLRDRYEIFEERFRWNAESFRKFHDVFQCNVPLSALNPTDVVTMQSSLEIGAIYIREEQQSFLDRLRQRLAEKGK
jgi:hypothetical protein